MEQDTGSVGFSGGVCLAVPQTAQKAPNIIASQIAMLDRKDDLEEPVEKETR